MSHLWVSLISVVTRDVNSREIVFPGWESQFPGLDRDSRFRPSTYFYLRDLSWIACGGAKGGGAIAGRTRRLPGRWWSNYGYQLTAAETYVPSAPYRLDTSLSCVSRRRRPCVWYVGHCCHEATSDRLIASVERPVTIISLTVGLLLGGRISLDSRNSRNSFPEIEKKNRDSLTSLVVTVSETDAET